MNGHAHTLSSQGPNGMPIAICGMGMRLPGGIRDESTLFEFLAGKQDARTKMPKSRYDVDAYYSEHGRMSSIKTQHGYFLDDVDLTKIDLSMFTMTAAEASSLDPSQRLLLEVAREALESAGESNFRGQNIGTYASVFSEDWQDLQNRDLLNEQGPYQLTGNYEYDLRGPSMTVKSAEAVSCLYVKRLDAAIRDRNPVRAVFRASATNADGQSKGLTVPNPVAHEALIRQTYACAGTAVGDPLEVQAVANCFGTQGMLIGSVKPNLGHSEGASAITSILKAVVALEHQTILPNIKFNTPNPNIPWKEAKSTVPTEPLPWPTDRCERMSVNSFGIGGSNAHFILDSARSFGLGDAGDARAPNGTSSLRPRNLLLISANHAESLKTVAKGVQEHLAEFPNQLESLAYTLAERREHLKLRGFGITNGLSPVQFINHSKDQRQGSGDIAFIFTGQGDQWPHMGRQLILEYPAFKKRLDEMDQVLQSLDHAPKWNVTDTLLNIDDKAILAEPEFSQPVCTAIQIALVDFLHSWGVAPTAVIGHSSGEIAATYAAGILTLREAVIVALAGVARVDGIVKEYIGVKSVGGFGVSKL